MVGGLIVDPAAPAALRDSGSYAWAVASAWRGDLMLLARTLRAAVLAITRADGAVPGCFVEIAVRDDVELFRSPADLKEWATPRAALRFDAIRVAVRGTATDLDLRIARGRSTAITLPDIPGVMLEVGSTASDGRAIKVLNDVRPSVGRAGFRRTLARGRIPLNPEPITGTDPAVRDRTLHERVERRIGRFAWPYLALTYGITAVFVAASDALAGTHFFDTPWSLLIVVFAPLPVLYGLLAVAQRDDLPIGPRTYALLFPAVELAEVTVGRRIARFAGRLALAAPVASIGVLVNAALT
ncbi:MAG TPA: hypothetical protein VF517_09430 [Thermoleophilaceae bacterium]